MFGVRKVNNGIIKNRGRLCSRIEKLGEIRDKIGDIHQ